MALKIAINGFGRIGRCAARIVLNDPELELAIINDTAQRDMTRYLLKYDSIHGEFDKNINIIDDDFLDIDGDKVRVYSTREISDMDLTDIDVVLECTGKFLTTEKCAAYLKAGAKKVVMSAPAKDDTPTYVLGVNSHLYSGEKIISNASCTTYCLGPIARVLEDSYGIKKGLMTTIHAYTNNQSLVDSKNSRDFRRSRAAAQNIIPTSTGAAKAMKLIMPSLDGKLHGQSLRVPVANVSMVDFTVVLNKTVSKDELNQKFVDASQSSLKGILAVDFDYRVSSDFISSKYASVVVADLTQAICDNMVKVMSWYDNEWGYSTQLVQMAKFVSF